MTKTMTRRGSALLLGALLLVLGGAAGAGDYGSVVYESDSQALVDAVNKDYPPDTSGTVNDPRILIPLRRHESATVLLDRLEKYYPPNTSGTVDDPRIQYPDHRSESGTIIIDKINRLYPPSGQ